MNVLKNRRKAGGAALVEALIVISSFLLVFMGITFFRALYITQIVTSRLSRGATLMYSMAGCEKVSVDNWLDKDKRKYTVRFPGKSNDVVPGGTSSGSSESQSVQNNIGAGNGSFANPIMAGVIQGTGWAGTKGLLSGTTKKFTQTLDSRSFVTCGDVPRDGDFDEVFGYVKDAFSGKMGG